MEKEPIKDDGTENIINNAMKKLEELYHGINELDLLLKSMEKLIQDSNFNEDMDDETMAG